MVDSGQDQVVAARCSKTHTQHTGSSDVLQMHFLLHPPRHTCHQRHVLGVVLYWKLWYFKEMS